MGCICTKVTPPPEQPVVDIYNTSSNNDSRRIVTPSNTADVVGAGSLSVSRNDSRTRLTPRGRESFSRAAPTFEDKVSAPAVGEVPSPRENGGHSKLTTLDNGPKKPMLGAIATRIPNAVEAEQVAAGWPSWLASVAGEAIKYWILRKASSFERLYKIGQGTYSTVYKARDLETGRVVALKKVRFINMDPESVRFMTREIHVLHKLNHPNIVKLEGLITSRTAGSLYLVFEYMEHDLAGLTANPSIQFTEPQIKCYMKQLLCGLEYCHNHGVMHRDIKGANLLVDSSGILKLADFGLATFFNSDKRQPLTSRVVTLWYRPPELLLGATNYDFTVDLWSSGCILAELLAGKPIMPGRTEVEQLHKIFKLCGSPSEEYWTKSKLSHATSFKPQRPYQPSIMETFKNFPSSALSLLNDLLAIEPDHRGTASTALKSDFFTTKPHACDPSALPKYPASKEFDAKQREEEAARKKERAVKVLGSGSVRKGTEYNAPQADEEHGASLQKRLAKSNPRSNSICDNYNTLDDVAPGFLINGPKQKTHSKMTHSGPFINPNKFAYSQSTSSKLNGAQLKGQAASTPDGVEDLSNVPGSRDGKSLVADINRERNKQNTSMFSPLDAVAAAKKEERWSSSTHNDEIIGSRESSTVYGAKKNRIHYSGPLIPRGGNMDEMLKEHERHIQQAVRKARNEKAMSRKNLVTKGPFEAGGDANLHVQ